jgi:hypothetical protein
MPTPLQRALGSLVWAQIWNKIDGTPDTTTNGYSLRSHIWIEVGVSVADGITKPWDARSIWYSSSSEVIIDQLVEEF